jgi:uncharacterized protein (DUF58 family)
VRLTRSPRLGGYAVVAALGFLAALALRRPELAVAAAPFALVLATGTALARDPEVNVDFALATDRTVERAEVEAQLIVRAERWVDRLEFLLDLPPGVEVVDDVDAQAIRVRAGEEREFELRLRCARWGLYDVGDVEVRTRDPLRLFVWEERYRLARTLKVYPRPESLSRILSPVETLASTGSEVARVKGDGVEYADIRDFVPGDRVRSINWRASARRGELVVNERHPERNTDVVLFVDSFTDFRGEGRSTLDDAVRATATLASLYLERRDRVGLIAYGGILRWLRPGMGSWQRLMLVETLLETGVEPTYTWRDVGLIPARLLPPKALVLAVSPLIDSRFGSALENLRGRGFDLAVVEVDPVGFVRPGQGELAGLAHRLWLLEREVLRARLERLGVGVARWGDDVSLEAALEGVREFRRHARLARI